ncbi:MAG: hypothetical protein GY722_06110 [bacterium]|nr:hypothetical protein [bacterium]
MRNVAYLGLLLALIAGMAVAEPAPDPRFEFLKGLAGTWEGTGLGDEEQGFYEFRVTAGGHAVEEREMVGSPHEMLTVYHMEGSDLVATHYCMLGNRPRMTAQLTGKELTFSCDGKPGGAASHAEHHVHGWAMKLDSEDRLHYSAELVEAGNLTHAPKLVLSRRR